MSPLREALDDYLRIRRRLGFEMPQDGRLLEDFVEFLEQAGAERITTELALMWARLPVDAHPHAGASGSGSCAGSPATWRRSTPQARSPRRICCPRIARGSRHTSTRRGDRGADGGRTKAAARRCAPRVIRR